MSLLVKSAIADSGEQEGSPVWVAESVALAFMAGVLQVALGLLGLGVFIRLCSKPVLDGFITATALLMCVNQMPGLLGVHRCDASVLWGEGHEHDACHFQEEVASLVKQLPQVHGTTCALSVVALAFLFGLKLVKPIRRKGGGVAIELARFGPIALVGITLVAFYAIAKHWSTEEDDQGRVFDRHWHVRLTGDVPKGLPGFRSPFHDVPSASRVLELVPASLVIGIVGFMESMAIATAMQRRTGLGTALGALHRARGERALTRAWPAMSVPGRELVALGVSNLAVSVFMGYPVTGSFSRTTVNAACGASSKLASAVSSLVVAVVLLVLTPALFYLPKFALSAIVLQSVVNLVDVAEAALLYRTSKREFVAFVTVLVVSLTLGFETGLTAGVVVSWMAAMLHTHVPRVSLLRKRARVFVDAPSSNTDCVDVAIVRLGGNLWFSAVRAALRTRCRRLMHERAADGQRRGGGADHARALRSGRPDSCARALERH